MRIARVTVFAFAVVMLLGASVASAQQPIVGIYFNEGGSIEQQNCPGPFVLDSLYVVASNFNVFITGIEFMVSYPPSMAWVSDFDTQPVTIGTTPTGLSMGWAIPQNGFFPLNVLSVLIQWNCTGCTTPNEPVSVVPHPVSGKVRVTRWPDFQFVDGIGLTALVCATVPVEETTWGNIKSLYQ